jgi:hypothetical protein
MMMATKSGSNNYHIKDSLDRTNELLYSDSLKPDNEREHYDIGTAA